MHFHWVYYKEYLFQIFHIYNSIYLKEISDSPVGIVTGWTGFDSRQMKETILFFTASRPGLGAT
jgi:hypothetical protein